MLNPAIWVFAEERYGALEPASFEALGEACRIARSLDARVAAVLLGNGVAHHAQALGEHGAVRVYVAEHPFLRHYAARPYTQVLTVLVEECQPLLFLFAATYLGVDLAPRVATRLARPLAANCMDIKVDSQGRATWIRPLYGGQFHARMVARTPGTVVVTLPRSAMEGARAHSSGKPEIVPVPVGFDCEDERMRVLETVKPSGQDVDLREAQIIISGGRGVGSGEGFRMMTDLADALGGSVAGTRPAFEAGWIPRERMVGQSGRTVAPRLYVACGISGAIHHRLAIRDAQLILAINSDPYAPIFRIADLGLVGDLHEILPELTRRVLLAQAADRRAAFDPVSGR